MAGFAAAIRQASMARGTPAATHAGLLFGTGRKDPTTIAAVGVVVLFTALLASNLPARRATRVDPMVTLRAEQDRQRPDRTAESAENAEWLKRRAPRSPYLRGEIRRSLPSG